MNSITVSWPDRRLSPNVQVHGAQKGSARKKQREEAFWLAKEAKLSAPASERILVRLDFYPKHKNRRDEDNMQASMKGALDGLAKALGVDDSLFSPRTVIHPADGRNVVVMTVEAL